MGSDLENLQSIAEDEHLSGLVETIIIHDDCENVDPYATRRLPKLGHPYKIWPRDETGRVISKETGIEGLTTPTSMVAPPKSTPKSSTQETWSERGCPI
jgi:hypothetical protein